MMNELSATDTMLLTLEVLLKIAWNFLPAIVLGGVFVTLMHAYALLKTPVKRSVTPHPLSKEDQKWQSDLSAKQQKEMHK